MPTKQEILGEIGETGGMKFLNVNRGLKVFKSTDRMDRVKDFYWEENGITKYGEIKTEMPYMKFDAFTFRQTQEFKCFSKSLLVFVTVPYFSNKFKRWYEFGGCIFLCEQPSKLHRYSYEQDFYGKKTPMIAVPFKQEGILNLVHRINPVTEKELWDNLMQNTSSTYRG